MPILGAYMVPHPPMIVPAVGRGSERQVEATTRAYEQVAQEIAALAPDTIILTSPHATMYADYFHISPGKSAREGLSGRHDGRARQIPGPRDHGAALFYPGGVSGSRLCQKRARRRLLIHAAGGAGRPVCTCRSVRSSAWSERGTHRTGSADGGAGCIWRAAG